MNTQTIIRPANPQTDFPRIAQLLTMTERYPVTAEELHEDEDRQIAGKIRRRAVAINDGEIAGYCYTVYYPSEPKGRFHVSVVADPALRNMGIGSLLYEDALRFGQEHGATILHTEVREQFPEALRFAEKRGFKVWRHAIDSALDLSTFDASAFEGLIESVEATGIRFFSLVDAGISDDTLHKLYAINRIAAIDDPASLDDSFPSFDTWRKIIVEASSFQPEGQLLAADGDDYVGLAAVGYDEESNSAEVLIAGVDPAYRGRKIGQALKLHTIRFAQSRGAATITTENDSRNEAMLAINRKFGYKPQAGYYALAKELALPTGAYAK